MTKTRRLARFAAVQLAGLLATLALIAGLGLGPGSAILVGFIAGMVTWPISMVAALD